MGRRKTSIVDSDAAQAAIPLAPIDRLPPKQRAFVKAYVDPESPTFGNQTQSYKAAYNTNSYVGTGSSAVRIVKENANVALAIRDEISRQGLGAEVRVGVIRSILDGRHKAKSTATTRKLADGAVQTSTESTPRAQDMLKAVALLDRLDGSEAARTAEAHARADVLKGLTKRIMGVLDDSPRPRVHNARKGRLRASSGNVVVGSAVESVDDAVVVGSAQAGEDT